MFRSAMVLLTILATIWMCSTTSEYGATEIGFSPPEPDPNSYDTIVAYGAPVTWVEWRHHRNEAMEINEAGFEPIRFLPLGVLLLAILTPAFLTVRGWKSTRPVE